MTSDEIGYQIVLWIPGHEITSGLTLAFISEKLKRLCLYLSVQLLM